MAGDFNESAAQFGVKMVKKLVEIVTVTLAVTLPRVITEAILTITSEADFKGAHRPRLSR